MYLLLNILVIIRKERFKNVFLNNKLNINYSYKQLKYLSIKELTFNKIRAKT